MEKEPMFYCSAPHPALSIVVPLYNEEANLPFLVEAVFNLLSADDDFLELVLVDDGSRDGTADLVLGLYIYKPRIRLVSHERNRGLGTAISTRMNAARLNEILNT